MFKAIRRTKSLGSARTVLLALASFADEDGLCFPSLRKLEKAAGFSRPTVISAIESLVQKGEVAVVTKGHQDRDRVKDRRRRGGFQATNYYQLLVVNPVNHLRVDHPGGKATDDKVVKLPGSTLLTRTSQLNKSAEDRVKAALLHPDQFEELHYKKALELVAQFAHRMTTGMRELLLRDLMTWGLNLHLVPSAEMLNRAFDRAIADTQSPPAQKRETA